MRKISKLLLTLALLVFGFGGLSSVKAGKTSWSPSSPWEGFAGCKWTAGTNTFSWNGTHAVVRAIETGFSGDLSDYTKFHATVSSLTGDGVDHLTLKLNCTGGAEKLVDLYDGENLIDMADWFADPTQVTTFELWGPSSSDADCSAVLTDVYLYMPPTLIFDASGKATTNKDDLSATGGLSYNSSTGVVTSDGTAGELKLEFAAPVDLKYLNYFDVKRSGTDDIIDRLYFYDEDGTEINSWGYTKFSNTWRTPGCDDGATTAFLNHKPVKKLVWKSVNNAANNGKTLTINSIEWTLKTISCERAGETQLNTLAWNKKDGSGTETPNWNMNVATDTYYGNFSSDPTHYVDLTAYEELRIYRDNNDGFRAFFINAAGNATNTISGGNATWNSEKQYWSIDLSDIEKWEGKVALKSIKSASSGTYNVVRNIVVYNTPAANAPQYTLTGSGMQLAETVAALADANATCIDATGVIGNTTNSVAGQTLLTSANPNCLFLGKMGNGYLSNTKNVVDGSTCANLVLEDGHPFKATADFTATKASYTTTINASAGAGTLCLPFEATIPGGVEAWTLECTSGDAVATATSVPTTIPANTPVLLNGSGEKTFTGASAVVSASATNKVGDMTGVFAATTVPVKSYVLQKQDTKVGFFQVAGDITINPFRAYLTAKTLAPSLRIIFPEDGDVTGIESVKAAEAKGEFFNLAGQRVAQPAKGLYIVNGKKIVVK